VRQVGIGGRILVPAAGQAGKVRGPLLITRSSCYQVAISLFQGRIWDWN